MEQTLYFGGVVHTMDASFPAPEAVLVGGERIAFVGDRREAESRAATSARRVDLAGRTLIPGFNDNHIHAVSMADYLERPRLTGMGGGQIVELLREEEAQPGRRGSEVLYAWGWDYPSCPAPHKSLLDAAFPHTPVVLVQFSGHGMWVNSAALRGYRIDRRSPDPPGGAILRDSSGEPTGVLRDAATTPLHRDRFQRLHWDRGHLDRLIGRALQELAHSGITSVQDNTWIPSTVGRLNRLRRRGRLDCRFSCWAYGRLPSLAWLMHLQRYDSEWVSRGPWKYLLDGTFSTRTAWLLEPYRGEPVNCGIDTGVVDSIHRHLRASLRRRRPAAFHAIGDRTVRELLDALQRLQPRFPGSAGLRLRIEHAQLIDPADIPRLRRLGVLVAAQPSALGTPEKDAELLGSQRALRAYPFRWLLDEGVGLSFGSDMPGESTLDPLLGIHQAVNREGPQRISAREALAAYTSGSACAEGKEGQKGTITPGKLADLVVLSEDPLAVKPQEIRRIRVLQTTVGGRVVYGGH